MNSLFLTVGLLALLSMLLAFHLNWSLVHTLLSPNMPARIQYTRELLLHWRSQESPADLILPIPVEPLRPNPDRNHSRGPQWSTRTRGRRGSTCLRKKQPLSCIPLPSIILSNAQSLRNKSEELQALVRCNHDFTVSPMASQWKWCHIINIRV